MSLTHLDVDSFDPEPWTLKGDFAHIVSLPTPPGVTDVAFAPPESRDEEFASWYSGFSTYVTRSSPTSVTATASRA